ncbi:MAG: nitrite reductase small subunit NirD [Methylacidiphilales bacterium]|nr:nitrite reductase small subunit NirD [Candidatus Methylacidiphilales bacterium]
MAFTEISLKLDEIPLGQSRCVTVGDAQVGLFRRDEGLFAIDNVCPHRGAPLHDGQVSDGAVVCPWHQWQFQLADGACRNLPRVRVASYPVEVRDGAIWIDLATMEGNPA